MTDEERLQEQIADIAGRALARGGLVGVILGALSSLGVALSGLLLTHDVNALPPFLFAAATTAFAFALRRAGVKRTRSPAFITASVLVFVSMPTLFFVVAELTTVGGAASYATGPFMHLYAFTVVFSGLWMRPRLPAIAGVVAALELGVVYALAHTKLAALGMVDPDQWRELLLPEVWAFKAVLIGGVGGMTAAIVYVARQLVLRVLAEERETREVSKLFGDFVSPDVRDKILRERGALSSERRRMAILFSDLRGFTTYSETKDPAVVVARLNAYFERMVRAVEKEGGVVDKFIGDAVMATFGGVVPLASPASAAVRAAKAMRAGLVDLNAAWAKEGVPAFDNGIGVHFGEVIEGPLGAMNRREYTVIGDVVNTASRVEGLTKEKERPILVTQAVKDALPPEEQGALEDVGEAHAKGKSETLRLFAVV